MKLSEGWALLLSLSVCSSFALDAADIAVIILSQDNPYNIRLAHNIRDEIHKQTTPSTTQKNPSVMIVPEDFPSPGAWTVIPILPKLISLHGDNTSWIFFCEDRVQVNFSMLLKGLESYDHREEQWIGYGLFDHEPSIIHHFAFAENPKLFKYPLFSAGFAMTTALLKKLVATGDKPTENPSEFSIDASHEFALFIGTQVPLLHAPDIFCVKEKPGCASYPKLQIACGLPLPSERIFFAVKTCHKFHNDRVPVVKRTWGKQAKHIEFFSDLQNDSIPTTFVGIENTERGHCSKSLKILEIVSQRMDSINSVDWVVLADDDTIISVPRLQSLLTCFEKDSVVGERYGYNVKYKMGYNYITGGGGIAIGASVVTKIVKNCHCPADDTPDDMFLGFCLGRLGIKLIHSPFFHQARPADYADGYLEAQMPVSFHKHWMVDPINVYNTWFSQLDHKHTHNEL